MSTFWIFIKWLPDLIKIAIRLEELAQDEILKFKIKRDKEKIELIFLSDKPLPERARELDEIFKG